MSKRKYPRSADLKQDLSGPAYITWSDGDEAGREKAIAAMNENLDSYEGFARASNRLGFSPEDIGGNNISGRYGMTHRDYEAWRPDEASFFKDIKKTILHADMCYQKHGLIKNVIDIMGDFASQGIRLVHPNKRIEKFFQNWFRRVRGVERSERFLNNLYRLGNVVVRVQTAKISRKVKEGLFRARANPDMDVVELNINKNEIPWKYTFLHPATVNVQGGSLANFSGNPEYSVSLPSKLSRKITSPENEIEKRMVAQLPEEIRRAAKSNKPIPLPPDKTKVFHYKKDDWQEWARPIISSIAIDISLYEKLKLADRAALDGATSNLRIIKLGSLADKIVPTAAAVNKVADIMASNTHAGTLDLIWGPDIELIESRTAVHNFLGQGKYEPTLLALYAGLGIPPTLTGTFGASGTTNNFVSLKTLIQRLEYGRDMLKLFWDEQIRIVQEAMGFRFPARVEFDLMNLGDEGTEKALLVQLADRNLISDELLQHYFGSDPEMERIRMKGEKRERERETRVEKAGPFYDPQFELALKKIFIQTGVVTPSEMGVELLPNKSGQKPAVKMKAPPTGAGGRPGGNKKKGVPGQGRPRNSKDTKKRQTKTFKPKVKASLIIWARAAQEVISDTLNPVLLDKFSKKNMRSLSREEVELADKMKFRVLSNLEPYSKLDESTIKEAISKPVSKNALYTYWEWERQVAEELNRNITADEVKNIQAYVYAGIHSEN